MSEQAPAFAARRFPAQQAITTTLFDLICALAYEGASDAEVISILSDLVSSGRVRLIGQFREPHIAGRALHTIESKSMRTERGGGRQPLPIVKGELL